MEYYENFQKFLKQMNNNNCDPDHKQQWEYNFENAINNCSLIRLINSYLK